MECCDCFDFCLPDAERKQKDNSRKLDKIIKEDKRRLRNQIKILLLGTGESGKSTFIRQMRIIYDNGYTNEEKMSNKSLILDNILNSMKAMIEAMHTLNIRYANKLNLRNAEQMKKVDICEFEQLTDVYVSTIKQLWSDAGIQECYRRRGEFQLIDSIKYYLSHIDRIADADYMPTEDDILHMRVPTTGLVEYQFKIKNVDIRMIDVGGQRTERGKWIHAFDNVKVIIFLVAISEYDQIIVESKHQNRLLESLNVFRLMTNYSWFDNTSFVVFFNKIDLLAEKIKYSNLAKFFPEFDGPLYDDLAARDFIEQMFLEVTPAGKAIYKHYTCATDTRNIEVVFAIVRDTILRSFLDTTLL